MSENFSISTFSSTIAKQGLYSSNKFEVEIQLPGIIGGANEARSMSIMCESASIAGRTISTLTDRIYGLKREIPYNDYTYDALQLTFVCSEDLRERKLLDKWSEAVVSPINGSDVAYFDTITSIIKVYPMDRYGYRSSNYQITYVEVFPKTVQAIELNHSTTNQISKVIASFSYSYYRFD